MTPNEYWLLHSVVDQKHSLSLLTMENVEALFDRPNHGMDRAALIAALARLFEQGLLIASNDERGDFVPNADDTAAALDGTLDADYGLTPAGGAAWEEVSKPDWNRYVDGMFGADSQEDFDSLRRERAGEFCCADREHLQKFMDSLIFRGIAPHEPSCKWDELAPWQALYWKELPSAHRVRFIGVGAPVWPEDKIPEEFRGMGMWYTPAEFEDE
ncbi:MAG TPA: hypothetical protein VKX17_02160 [Planctomycetota bacterium]|nr:hypothetical protein [Planctomycetota bacterium]